MKWLDLTLATPAENLACDEALLDLCEESGVEILRFWESREPFVVIGYGNRFMEEANVDECRLRGVPILRRCSGGGAVVQGPGCLNYNLTLRIPESGPLTTVTGTNEFVMERNRATLEGLLGLKVTVQGHTDLAFAATPPSLNPDPALTPPLGTPEESESRIRTRSKTEWEGERWLKFSGNAQRRRRRSLVFHGTFLYGFDLSLIDSLLRFPSQQPDYRSDRPHADFVRNIPATAEQIREHLRGTWRAYAPIFAPLPASLEPLLREHYLNPAWNFSR